MISDFVLICAETLYDVFCEGQPTISLELVKNIVNTSFDHEFCMKTETSEKVKLILSHSISVAFSFMNVEAHQYILLANDIYRYIHFCVNNIDSELYYKLAQEVNMFITSATLIQNRWREAIANPNYKVCKNRLLREFYEM
jgi:hypothetical protein